MPRRARTTLQRAALFEKHGGICHLCEQKINVGEAWDLEHIIPYELTQDDTDENLRPAHTKCHKTKSARDMKVIAKVRRVEAKHKGAKAPAKRKIPGSKGTGMRKKLNGTVEFE